MCEKTTDTKYPHSVHINVITRVPFLPHQMKAKYCTNLTFLPLKVNYFCKQKIKLHNTNIYQPYYVISTVPEGNTKLSVWQNILSFVQPISFRHQLTLQLDITLLKCVPIACKNLYMRLKISTTLSMTSKNGMKTLEINFNAILGKKEINLATKILLVC